MGSRRVRRPHLELSARDLEARGLAPATVTLQLVVLTGFYRDLRRGAAPRTLANGHRTLRIVGKRNQPALITLTPRTMRAIDSAVGERTHRWIVGNAVAPEGFSFTTLEQYYRALDVVSAHKDVIERHVYSRGHERRAAGRPLRAGHLHEPDLKDQPLTADRAVEELDQIRQVTFTAGDTDHHRHHPPQRPAAADPRRTRRRHPRLDPAHPPPLTRTN